MGLAAHPPERELKWSSNECRQRPWSASPCSAQPAPAHADTAETCVTRFYPAIAGEARGKEVEAVKIEMNIAKLIFGKTAEGRECEAVKLIRGKKAAAGAAWGEIVADVAKAGVRATGQGLGDKYPVAGGYTLRDVARLEFNPTAAHKLAEPHVPAPELPK
jgi:hypothetical protein